MEEIKTGENPDQKSTTEEQIEEKGEDDPEEEEVTEETPAEEQEEQEPVTEEPEIEEPEAPAATTGSETDSLEEAEKAKTTIAAYEKKEDNTFATLSKDSADIEYTQGCSSKDGGTIRAGVDVTFLVLPAMGKKVTKVSWAAVDAAPEAATVFAEIRAESDGSYKLTAANVTSADGKKIAILVETEAVTFTLSSGATLVKEENDATTQKKKLTTLTGDALKIAYSDASSITLNITADKDAEYTAEAKIDANAETNLGAGSQTVIPAADSSTGEELVYRTYTLDATKLAGADGNKDQTVTLTFTTKDAVTVAAAEATVGTGYTFAAQAVDSTKEEQKIYVPYKDGADSSDNTYNPGDKVVFAVTPEANTKYDIDKVEATLTNSDGTKNKTATLSDVTDTFVAAGDTTGKKVYAAEIPADIGEDYTLKINVTTKIKADADTVTVNYTVNEAYADKVTIKAGVAENSTVEKEAGKEDKFLRADATGKKYYVNVAAKDGYKLSKLEVVRDGQKKNEGEETTSADTKTKDVIEDDIKDGTAVYDATAEILLEQDYAAADGAKAYKFTANTVAINIEVVPDGAQEEMNVTFESVSGITSGIPCKIAVDKEEGKVTYTGNPTETGGTANIKEDTEFLTFHVVTATEPGVKVFAGSEDETARAQIKKLGAANGSYGYQIPAKNLRKNDKIEITRAKKTVRTNVTGGAVVAWKYTNKEAANKYGLQNSPTPVDADEEILFTVTAGERAITSVTYKLGADGTAQEVPEGNTGYEFAVKATDNIIVDVVCESDERILVTETGEDDVVVDSQLVTPGTTAEVGYENNISVELKDKDSGTVDIINAYVYDKNDNGALAKTKPTVTANKVTFKVDEKELNKDLTVTLVKKNGENVTFYIKSDALVDGVTYGEELGADRKLVLSAGESRTITVASEAGKIDKLRVGAFTGEITAESKLTADKFDIEWTEGKVTATVFDGVLTVRAAADAAKNDTAATFVLCRLDGTILPNSDVKVATTAAVMQAEAVKDYTEIDGPVGRHVTIKMDGEKLAEIAEKLSHVGYYGSARNGAYYIKVDTSKLPDGTSDEKVPAGYAGKKEDWQKDYAKITSALSAYTSTNGKKVTVQEMIEAGNQHQIKLIPDSVAAVALEFTITITPAQTISYPETVYTENAWTSDAIKTTVPSYSESLTLGNEKAVLQTGRDEDIVVASPVFAGEDRNKWIVEPEIVDKATGMPREGRSDDFDVKWDAVNKKVTINAKDASAYYNNHKTNNYKNLMLKVTVYTEDRAYGVSALKPITVESGIEDIALNVQNEIVYDNSNKKVTVNSAVTYNPGYYNANDRKPKKAAAYFDVTDVGAALKSGLSIDHKNGKITLDKGITLSETNEADNQFTVVAKANDYETKSNDPEDPRVDTVEVTVVKAAEEFEGVYLFDVSDNSTNRAKIVADVDTKNVNVEVSTASGEYRVAALKKGAKTNRDGKTYNLYQVAYDYSKLSIQSSSKSVVIDPDGSVTIKKMGKTNITVQVKSDKKLAKKIQNVNFIVKQVPIVAVLTEYENSNFDKPLATDQETTFTSKGTWNAVGNATGYYTLELKRAVLNEAGEVVDYKPFYLPNHSVSFKNAKKAANKALNYSDKYYFTATGGGTDKNKTVVTIKNKEKNLKSNEITIDIFNAKRENAKNAPKLQMADKKAKILSYQENGQEVEIAVTSAKKTESLWAAAEKDGSVKDTYVVLSIDQNKDKDGYTNAAFGDDLDHPIALERVSDIEGRFWLGVGSVPAGNYSLIASLGTMENGVFEQTHKDAALNLKVTKSDDKIKATAKYTLNPYGVSSRPFDVKGGDYDVTFRGKPAEVDVDENGVHTCNWAKNVILPGGKENKFNQYFTIKTDGTGWDNNFVSGAVIGIKKGLSKEDIDYLAGKESKDDLTGYVTVTNGQRNVDLKITVAIQGDPKQIKLKTTATPVLTMSGNSVSDITVMNGKETVDIEKYQLTGKGNKTWGFQPYIDYVKADAAATDAVKAAEQEAEQERLAKGIIRVIAKQPVKGNHEFDLKVITKDMVDCTRQTAGANNTVVDTFDNAPSTSGKIAVSEANKASNKIVFAKNATNWTVQNTDWWADTDGTNTWNVWSTDRTFTFKNYMPSVATIKAETESANAGWFSVGLIDLNEDDGNDENNNKYNGMDGQRIALVVDKDGLKAAVGPKSKVKLGKANNVKVTFSYYDKDGRKLGGLKEDTVTFKVTLPKTLNDQEAATLVTLLQARQKNFQNLADRWSRDYTPTGYDWENMAEQKKWIAEVAEGVAYDLESEAKRLADGTSAVIKVEGKAECTDDATRVTAIVYTYTVKVNDEAVFTLVSKYTYNDKYAELKAALEDIADELATPEDGTAETYGLHYAPAMTTADDFKAVISPMLKEANVLTNSMVVDVTEGARNNDYSPLQMSKLPTTEEDGYFRATVTVTDMDKRNYSDGNTNVRVTTQPMEYTFSSYTDEADYQDENKDVIISKVLTDIEMSKLIINAQNAVENGIDADSKFSDEMKIALREEIRKFADEKCNEGNQDLHATAVGEAGFDVSFEGEDDAKAWKIEYVVDYTSSKGTFSVEGSQKVTIKGFVGLESVADLKGKVDTELAKPLGSEFSTPAAALAEVQKIVTEQSKNPANKPVVNMAYEGAFSAPTADAAGWIKVTVTYGEDDTKDYVVMIKQITDDTEYAGPSDVEKAKAAVTALMTKDAVNEAVKDAWNAAVEGDATTFTDTSKFDKTTGATYLATALEKIVTEAGYTVKEGAATVTEVTLPTSSTATGSYKDIKIVLKDDSNADVPVDITVNGVLDADPVYQNEEEFMDAVAEAINVPADGNGGYKISYNGDWITPGENEGDPNTVADAATAGIKGAIEAKVKTIKSESLLFGTAYTNKITADMTGVTPALKGTDGISATGITLTFNGETDDAHKRKVSVEVYGDGKEPKINGVTITVDDKDASAEDGSGSDNKYEIASATEDKAVTVNFEAKVSAQPAGTEGEEVVWTLQNATTPANDFDNVTNKGTAAITLEADTSNANKATLTIPAAAYLTGATEIAAVVRATSKTDDTKKADFYVNIALTEKVNGITITGPAKIEAPATTEEGDAVNPATYKATLAGIHVDPANSSKVTWTLTGNEDGKMDVSGGVVSVKEGAAAKTGVKLTASYGGQTEDALIDVVANGSIKTNTTVNFESVDGAAWTEETGKDVIGNLVVSARTTEDVKVPLTITSADKDNDGNGRDLSELADSDFKFYLSDGKDEDGKLTYAEDPLTSIKVVTKKSGKDRGKRYLVITKDAPEILEAADGYTAEDGTKVDAVPATVCKMVVNLPADTTKGQTATTAEFEFNIVINQYMKTINFIAEKAADDAYTVEEGNIINIEKVTGDDAADITVDLKKSTVTGAHIADADQKAITYVIMSKENGSKSSFTADGVLTIKTGGQKDRIIRVKATAKNDKNATKASSILTIKVTD